MKFIKRLLKFIFATSDYRVSIYISLIAKCKKKNYKILGVILTRMLQRNYGVFISYETIFDNTLLLRHPVGIVIGEGVRLGKNITIFQNVTVGRSDTTIAEYPTVGDNTIIYSGAVLLGNIVIGENCIIGANSVVTKSIPANSIVVGIPARIIGEKRIN